MSNEADRGRRRPIPVDIPRHPDDEPGLTVYEFAARSRVQPLAVYRWIRAGMPTHQPGGRKGRHVIYLSEVEAWAREFRCIGAAQGHDASSNIDRDTEPEPNGHGTTGDTEAVS